jgi:hypothetical protein
MCRQGEALSVVADALAVTNPDRAERIACFITDENSVRRVNEIRRVSAHAADHHSL